MVSAWYHWQIPAPKMTMERLPESRALWRTCGQRDNSLGGDRSNLLLPCRGILERSSPRSP